MRSFLRVLSIILLVCWMALIFFLSAQTNEVSSQTSGQVIEIIAEKIYPDYEKLTETEQTQVIEEYQFIARKTAHVLIYAVLGFFAFLTFVSYVKLHFFTRAFLALLISLGYAASDEVHQLFVMGRSCELRDFLIDALGALVAILLASAFVKIIPPLRRNTAFVGVTKKSLLQENYNLNTELQRIMQSCKNLQKDVETYKMQINALNKELEQMKENSSNSEWEKPLQDDVLEELEVLPQMEEIEIKQKSKEIQLPEVTLYAASVIGKAVVAVTKLCNKLTLYEQDDTRRELVNLALGRTEVLKAEILKVLKAEISFEEKKNLIEKESQDAYDYFDSIIAQIS